MIRLGNLRYNGLALLQAVIGFAGALLLIKVFGVSAESDAYFIGFAIYTAAGLIPVLFIEQFMVFYHRIKAQNAGDEKNFYAYALFLALLTGIITFAALNLFGSFFIRVFAASLDPSRFELLSRILVIFSLGAALRGVLGIMEGLFNAENRFSVPYILNMLPQGVLVCVLAVMLRLETVSVLALPSAFVLGSVLSVMIGFILLGRMGFPVRLRLRHPCAAEFVRNSFFMRMGHNLHAFLNPIVINNVLAALPVGGVSCYGYANRFISAAGSIITGPLVKVFYSKASAMWAANQREGVKREVRQYLKVAAAFFSAAVVCGYFLIPQILELVASARIDGSAIGQIQKLFLALSVWYGILLVESPFVGIIIVSCNSLAFIITNGIFIAVFAGFAFLSAAALGVYAVPAGLAVAQTISTAIYINTALVSLNSRAGLTGASLRRRVNGFILAVKDLICRLAPDN